MYDCEKHMNRCYDCGKSIDDNLLRCVDCERKRAEISEIEARTNYYRNARLQQTSPNESSQHADEMYEGLREQIQAMQKAAQINVERANRNNDKVAAEFQSVVDNFHKIADEFKTLGTMIHELEKRVEKLESAH